MVPRGEVGLIFAATGSALGVLSSELFSTIVLVVIITTFVSPALIKILGKKLKDEDRLVVAKSKLRIVNEAAVTKTTTKKPAKNNL